jgi:hypothetical protein
MLIILELIAIHYLIRHNGVLIGLSLDILLNLLGFIACICLIQGVRNVSIIEKQFFFHQFLITFCLYFSGKQKHVDCMVVVDAG